MEADVVEESEDGFGLMAEGVPHEGDGAGGDFAGERAIEWTDCRRQKEAMFSERQWASLSMTKG